MATTKMTGDTDSIRNVIEITEPIPFISMSPDGVLEITSKAKEYLHQIHGPIAVISIAGLYRTGKSYLLNLLLGREIESKMFNVGATVNACTKGIWIWGQPFLQSMNKSNKMYQYLPRNTTIIFMDTEGLGSTKRSETQDTRIFTLALLLSSLFIYNSRGVIDSNAISDLSLVVHLTKYIQTKTNTNDEKEVKNNEFGHIFPDFIWVLRDFTLQLEENGIEITEKEYLEMALSQQSSESKDTIDNNLIRSLLVDYFPNRDCITMVRPLNDESKLQELTKHEITSLRQEFQQQLIKLRSMIFEKIKPNILKWSSTAHGVVLNGKMLEHLAQNYIDIINSGSTPVLSTVWERVIENQWENALSESIRAYETALVNQCSDDEPLDDVMIQGVHENAREAALSLLSQLKPDDNGLFNEQYCFQLAEHMNMRLKELFVKNDSYAKEYNEKLIFKLYNPLDLTKYVGMSMKNMETVVEMLQEELQEFRKNVQELLENYNVNAVGNAKSLVSVDFITNTVLSDLEEWGKLVFKAIREIEKSERETISAREQELSSIDGKAQAIKQVMLDQKESYEKAISSIITRTDEERAASEIENTIKDQEVGLIKQQLEDMQKLHQEAYDALTLQLEGAKEEQLRCESARKVVENQSFAMRSASSRHLLETQTSMKMQSQEQRQSQQEITTKLFELEKQLGELEHIQLQEIMEKEKASQSVLTDTSLMFEKELIEIQNAQANDIRNLEETEGQFVVSLQDELKDKRALLASLRERLETQELAAIDSISTNAPNKNDCVVQ